MMKFKKLMTAFLTAAMLVSNAPSVGMNFASAEIIQNYDSLDRGLVAIKVENGVYLSWRLDKAEDTRFNGTSAEEVSFNIYRDGTLIATEEKTTNYTDTEGTEKSVYTVEAVNGVKKGEKSKEVSAFSSKSNYFDIPLQVPANATAADGSSFAYSVGDCSCGDLDGDGEYEIVVKWEANPQDNSNSGYTGSVLLDAYKLDGTFLWRIDLGLNIRSGAHYTQFLVYDFDMDGKAEITAKTAPGSKDGQDNFVTEASSDSEIKNADNTKAYVNSGGYILEGPEYFTIFDGETGIALDTINYPNQRVSASVWGDDYGNRCDRFIATVSYLDGERPYAVYWRGYYYGQDGQQRTAMCGIGFDGERLVPKYMFDTLSGQEGYKSGFENYVGQGNHNITTADVDNDGKDEFISGALCMEVDDNDKLVPKWCSWRGHGDALHIGDYDPTHEGYEYFSVHESGNTVSNGKTLDYGMTVYDAATGKELLHAGAGSDTGRGVMANVGAGGYYQFWGAGTYKAVGEGNFEEASVPGTSSNFRIFWNGDMYDDLLDGTKITSWNGSKMSGIFSAENCTKINGSKSNPALSADLFGDWREEVVYPLNDNTALRVYATTYKTDYKMASLMQDRVYRAGVAAEQTAYNQPPHIGYYMDEEEFNGTLKKIKIKSLPAKTTYFVGESFDTTGMVIEGEYENGTIVQIYAYNVLGFDTNSAGTQKITLEYKGCTQSFNINVNTGFKMDENGLINGYSNTAQTDVILPENISSAEVKGFSENALADTNIEKLYIYDESIEYPGGKVFGDNITVYCYEESTTDTYLKGLGITPMYIGAPTSDTVTYDEDFYKNYAGGKLLTQTTSAQNLEAGFITYLTTAGMDFGGYIDITNYGFYVETKDNNNYLKINPFVSFGDDSLSVYIALNETALKSKVSEASLAFDICIPSAAANAYVAVNDGVDKIDTISIANLGLSADTWYKYELKYIDGVYKRTVYTNDGEVFLPETTLAEGSGENVFSRISMHNAYKRGQESFDAYFYMDNIAYEKSIASEVIVNVIDENGAAVEGALVEIDGKKGYTNENGDAVLRVSNGKYEAVISADGYESAKLEISARKDSVSADAVIKKMQIKTEKIILERNNIVLKAGSIDVINSEVSPVNTEEKIVYKSENESIATISENGVISAVSEGETVISVISGDIEEKCSISVIADDYEPVVSAIEIIGKDSAHVNSWYDVYLPEYKAYVYDQNGVRVYTNDIVWNCENGEITSFGEAVVIKSTGDEGEIKLSAECTGVKAEKTITKVNSNKSEKIINADLTAAEYKSISMTQGREAQSVTAGDFTFNVGLRSGGGDGITGFVYTQDGMMMQAGRFSYADAMDRHAYVEANSKETFDSAKTYRFSMDVCFESNFRNADVTRDMNIIIGNANETLTSFNATDRNLEKGKWYTYSIMYSNGIFTEYIYDENGTEISSSELDAKVSSISKIDFIGSNTATDNQNTAVKVKNILIDKFDKTENLVMINVIDENANPVSGVEVKLVGTDKSAVTNKNGNAYITGVYAGANVFCISEKEVIAGAVSADIAEDNQKVIIKAGKYSGEIVKNDENSFTVIYHNNSTMYEKADMYEAVYDENGAMSDVGVSEEIIMSGNNIRVIDRSNANSKLMVWRDMKPVI